MFSFCFWAIASFWDLPFTCKPQHQWFLATGAHTVVLVHRCRMVKKHGSPAMNITSGLWSSMQGRSRSSCRKAEEYCVLAVLHVKSCHGWCRGEIYTQSGFYSEFWNSVPFPLDLKLTIYREAWDMCMGEFFKDMPRLLCLEKMLINNTEKPEVTWGGGVVTWFSSRGYGTYGASRSGWHGDACFIIQYPREICYSTQCFEVFMSLFRHHS